MLVSPDLGPRLLAPLVFEEPLVESRVIVSLGPRIVPGLRING